MSVDLPFHKSWLEEEEHREVEDTLNSGWLTTGPKAQKFEEAFKDYIGCKHAVALNSCTAGLNLALTVQNFAEGDEVITTPMTFPATTNVILLQRLKPVFADIEPGTLTIDPRKIEAKITPRTRAIIPVHFAGHPCDMTPIQELADRHKLVIIEDAAHALESGYKGKKIGNLGNATAFSFYANKNITTGEGGMLVTNDDALAETIRIMRLQGISRDAWKRYGKSGFSHWEHTLAGHKCNMSDLNASIGMHQIKKVERFMTLRKKYVSMYDRAFADVAELETLAVRDYATHAHHLYVISLHLERLTIDRDGFLDAIQSTGIGVALHYVALHLQPYYVKNFNTKPQDFPIASNYSERVITLPLYPKMSSADVERVIGTVKDLIKKFRR
ncbi:MAG TPA: DegT/DnrJ/EryC1/StrS family aminotransferase [Nitrospinaceae bacterium]|jgi:dTDP-4-amino-4,6-dideoxygalactose transaminase|nr:DegT/DnrJ/EryC1/StrS family aminotransferase [Nitrospinaceae bacterium]HIE79310.1 DegT/DnrJ/EryC1/StrS family aminotransferase [Nitrospinaceae bacterium]|tara:strand:- start:2226 stop:3383 length:1158 start_codon:yes stop_codon:yes gene_type:complete